MSNPHTRRVSLKFGPLFLETLVKHYFARVVSDGSKAPVPLQREELLYDAAFNIVKVRLVFRLARESQLSLIFHQRISWTGLRGKVLLKLSCVFGTLSFQFSIQGTRSKNCNPS
jgi:hypothetical protein